MKRRSFRLRIALLAAGLAGGALIGFGAISWWLIHDAKVSRLSAELDNQLMRSARPGWQDWQAFETFLPQALGTGNTAIALLITDRNGSIVYQSNRWPTDLNLRALISTNSLPRFATPPTDEPRFTPFDNPRDRSRDLYRAEPPPPPKPQITTQRTHSGAWQLGVVALPDKQVAIAVSLAAVNQEMTAIGSIFLITIPVVLLLVAGGAWQLAGSALSPIYQLTHTIRQVTVKGLDQRVPLGATDIEFVELIQVFNQMLERLERSFQQASRFSADAAHELKTPLTILQGELEQTIQKAEPGSEMQQNLCTLLDEVSRLSGIIRKLLLLSRADAGQMRLPQTKVDFSELLREIVEDIKLLAPELTVNAEIADSLKVLGDRDLLTQVLQNLVSNAIKYNLPQGWIQIQAQRQASTILVTISNASSDIPASDRPRIFDRFHRVDRARTRQVEGIGLGLSLAREIARAHKGNLILNPQTPGETSFTLSLPIAP